MPNFDPGIDYYAILQVHPQAHQAVIKRAYRTIVGLLQSHPDLGGTHEDAVRVNDAYAILSHPETRKAYDTARRQHLTATARPRPATVSRAPGAGPNMHAAASPPPAQAPHGTPSGGQTLRCVHCGAHNRLPRLTDPQQAVCGKCHAPLVAGSHTAHVTDLPPGDVHLSARLTERLLRGGEVRLHRAKLPADHQLTCLRCHHVWVEATGMVPFACPHCHSRRWSDFRLFCCRHCGHQFTTRNLTSWPYKLFAVCPACHQTRWHTGSERHPLRWLLNQFAK